MPKLHLTFAKIVAAPSDEIWSQAYHAGTLGALISLKKMPSEKKEIKMRESLHTLGKELISTLESEYFTLPTKNLAAIKEAFDAVVKKIPDNITPSLALASVTEHILYIFAYGNVSFLLKRGNRLGILLTSDKQETSSASGPLEQNDIIILQTQAFGDIVPSASFGSLDPSSLSDTAEKLSPSVHKSGQADAAAVLFSYHMQETSPLIMPATPPPETAKIETAPEESITAAKTGINAPVTPAFSRAKRIYSFSHMQKILATVGVLLVIILIIGVYFSLKHRQDQKIQTLFQSLYPPAEKKYEEGQNLVDLNANLAEGDFIKTQTMLQDSQNKFPADSNEAKQIAALLAKVNDALKNIDTQNASNLSEADKSNSPLLSAELQNHEASYGTQDDNNVYLLNGNNIYETTKNTNKTKQIITNNNTWSDPAGMGVYYGNIYVADKKDGIDKFVSSGSSFSKTNYFADGVNADLSKGQAIAIDSSIYVLFSDGSIAKFTRGKPDSFSVSGLDKQFNSPTRIFTDANATNIYILDNGNGRIVVLNKSGQYQQQYAAGQLKKASDFDVQEKNKVIYILSGGKIWKVDLK